jgi:hypothetical protein
MTCTGHRAADVPDGCYRTPGRVESSDFEAQRFALPANSVAADADGAASQSATRHRTWNIRIIASSSAALYRIVQPR